MEEIKKFDLYYVDHGFYSSEFLGTIKSNGLLMEDLTPISQEDYDSWWNPPEGKYGGWVDGHPVLLDIPPVDYVHLAEIKKSGLRGEADYIIAPLQDAVDVGDATEQEIYQLNLWKSFRMKLNRVDLSNAPNIDWPEKPTQE